METNNMIKYKNDSVLSQGYGILPKLIMRDTKLSIEAKAIYAYMCSFAGAGQKAFPGVELMCYELNISEKRFYKYRKELLDFGYISIEKQRKGNRRESNIYTLEQIIFEHSQFESVQNESVQIERVQNVGGNTNSTNINSTNINNINSSSSRANEDITLEKYFEENICKLRKTTKEKFNNVCKSLSKDLIKSIIDYGAETNATSYSWFEKVVNKKIKDGISTKEEFELSVKNFRENKVIKKNINKNSQNKKDSFNNFEHREYNYSKLEKELLGW